MRVFTVGILLSATLAAVSCGRLSACGGTAAPPHVPDAPALRSPAEPFALARDSMVAEQIEARGVSDPRVLAAMRKVPRHEFVPAGARPLAYVDRPLPIQSQQTISQPYIVALMTELAAVDADSKVLEIGTGSGYQAAVLAEIAGRVYTVEIIGSLASSARRRLRRLGYENVEVAHGDGYQGWPEHAPFDAIIVTAAPPQIPEALRQQLAVGGRLVIPVGDRYQELRVVTRTPDGFDERSVLPVRFVPMTEELR